MNNHTDLQPNRRLRDRMSGGVRGRGLATLSYSIIMKEMSKTGLTAKNHSTRLHISAYFSMYGGHSINDRLFYDFCKYRQ